VPKHGVSRNGKYDLKRINQSMKHADTISGGLSAERLSRLTRRLESYVDSGAIAGVVAMIHRHEVTVYSAEIGWQDEAAQKPMQADTVFRIASMTKPITSVAALMLLEEGLLRLDDPIERWLPEFADPQVLRRPDAALDDTQAAERSILVHDLLTHRAGIVSHFFAEGALAEPVRQLSDHPLRLNAALDPDTWLQQLGRLPLVYQPGTTINYGWATDVLGFLVARAAGTDFAEFLRTRLFEPLGMLDTGFSVPPDSLERLSVGYAMSDGRRVAIDDPATSPWRSPPLSPSGSAGLVSTASDYLRFSTMLLNGGAGNGARILSRKTIELMTADTLMPQQRALPFHDAAGYWAGQGFGLGVSVVDDLGCQYELGSPGKYRWGGAYGTWWFNDPRERLSAVLMMQLFEAYRHIDIHRDFENLVYQAIVD
jgi:CubicO group peptidase (beta-lactamase class C family)